MAVLLLLVVFCGQGFAQLSDEQQKLKRRDELPAKSSPDVQGVPVWVVPAGTKIPIQLRQAVSTKNAQPGDPIYGQTTFPVIVDNTVMIPAGTFVKGMVDTSKRAGRIKGKAELQFHLTSLIYANGYTLEIAAAVDQVPGSIDTHMKEPGKIERDAAKGEDLKTIADGAATGGQIGALAGATTGSIRGLGVGGVGGIAAGSLIGILARGADVRFEMGSGVEISLNRAIARREGQSDAHGNAARIRFTVAGYYRGRCEVNAAAMPCVFPDHSRSWLRCGVRGILRSPNIDSIAPLSNFSCSSSTEEMCSFL